MCGCAWRILNWIYLFILYFQLHSLPLLIPETLVTARSSNLFTVFVSIFLCNLCNCAPDLLFSFLKVLKIYSTDQGDDIEDFCSNEKQRICSPVIDPRIHHELVAEQLYLNMRFKRQDNWYDPTWKFGTFSSENKQKTILVKYLLCGFLSADGIHYVKLHIIRINPPG